MREPQAEELLEYLRKVTADLVIARQDLDALRGDDPIAIVGMGCRLPGGVGTPEALWEVLDSGEDLVGDFPTDRGWSPLPPGERGPVPTRGAFLADAAGFDNRFFAISPREAKAMDPQQRIALEVAWETLEAAGMDPTGLRGERVGVYLGATSFGYGGDPVSAEDDVAGHLLIGTVPSVLSGRISYTLGLQGPSVTLDTACSSALVAVHLAAAALRTGECEMALAGGAAVIATPGVFVEFQRQGGLSSDGRCRAFAEEADGTGWGEGVTMVALERLSRARAQGHRVLAIVKGTACNHGGAANGLTAPNGLAQQSVIRDALMSAGLRPDDIDAVEAHGTGTTLGDPLEASALQAVFAGRTDPVWLGSLKSNIGHTQAAAGTAGLIKLVLALRHGWLPRTLHASNPSSDIAWEAGPLRLLQQAQPWARVPGRPRRAGVSAFGVGGTNAHVVLEEPPADAGNGIDAEPDWSPLLLSAADDEALAAWAARLREATGDWRTHELASALSRRAALPVRAAMLTGPGGHLSALSQVQGAGDGVVRGRALDDPRPVLVFPGQGSQWAGMAVDLLAGPGPFSARLDACDRALSPHVPFSVRAVLEASATDPTVLEPVDVVQPVLWAVMVSLAALWSAAGIEPAAVIGHSQGEIAAAVVSGHLTLEEGARIVARRSRLLRRIVGQGGMVSLLVDSDRAEQLIAPWAGEVAVAVVNGSGSTVVAGADPALAGVMAEAERAGIRAKRIDVDYASHSPQVEPLSPEISAELAGIPARPGRCAWFSSVTGAALVAGVGGDYWADNLRSTVRLDLAIAEAVRRGHRLFIEVSPHPVLTYPLTAAVESHGAAVVATLHRDEPGPMAFARSAATAWVHGAPVDRPTLVSQVQVSAPLPTYPFRRTSFWYAPKGAQRPDHVRGLAVKWRQADVPVPMSGEQSAVVLADPDDALADQLAAHLGIPRLGRLDDVASVPSLGRVVLVSPRTTADGAVWTVAQVARFLQSRDDVTALAVLTRGATPTDQGAEPAQAAVSGFLGAFAAEEPDRVVVSVDLDDEATGSPAGIERVAACLMGDQAEQYAVRGGELVCRRVTEVTTTLTHSIAPAGTAVVVGGLGRLGSALARELAARGTRRIVLVDRRGHSAHEEQLLAELRTLGSAPVMIRGDASVPEVVAEALDTPAHARLELVVHAAGHLADEPVSTLSRAALNDVLAAKLGVAECLVAAVPPDVPLVLTSALPGTVGIAGQSAWASATAAVDALAHRRATHGGHCCAVAFGGLSVAPDADVSLTRIGVTPWSTQQAVNVLLHAPARPEATQLWADLDLVALVASGRARRQPALTLPGRAADATGAVSPPAFAEMDATRALGALGGIVRAAVAESLGMQAREVDEEVSFKELGLDSLTAVQLRNRLNAATGARLPVTIAFDRPTPALLTAHLVRLLVPDADPEAAFERLLSDLERLIERAEPQMRGVAARRLREMIAGWTRPLEAGPSLFATGEELFAALDAELGLA